MFGKRKYTMRFQKKYIAVNWGHWKEISDYRLLECLTELQKNYNFEIVKIKFGDCFDVSEITIKCKKEDKQKIFTDYVTTLGNYIINVVF